MPETVYLGHDNEVIIILQDNGSAIDISGATTMTLKVGNTLITSTNGSTSMILWAGTTYAAGEVHLKIGGSTDLSPGIYRAPLTVYDAASTQGIVFGKVHLELIADVEAT